MAYERRLMAGKAGPVAPAFALAVCLLAGLFLAVPAAFSQDDVMTLDAKAFATPERPSVSFPHGAHAAAFDCTACHHKYEKSANFWSPGDETSCAACHRADDTGKLGLRRAWHALCLGCHQEKGVTSPNAPVMCGQCHREPAKERAAS